MPPSRAIVVRPGEGRRLDLDRSQLHFVADEPETNGRFALAVVSVAPGDPGTTPHVHREHDDLSFVIEGALSYEIAGEQFEAPAGTLVLVPPGLRHRWWNPRPEPAAFLNIHVAGYGFERFVRELVELSQAGLASPEAMAELGARHDVFFDAGALRARYE